MKKLIKITMLMLLIIGTTYALAFVLKSFGIYEGWPTKIVPFTAITIITIIFSRRVNKATFVELGLGFNMKNVPITLVSICLSGIPLYAGLLLEGSIELKKPFDISLLGFISYYFLVAFSEEFLYRGYIGKILENNRNITKSVISALAFAGFHFISPEFNLINFILLFIFGVIFMYMYILVRNLWPLIFFHLSWDVLSEYVSIYQNALICLAGLLITIFVLLIISKRNYRAKVD